MPTAIDVMKQIWNIEKIFIKIDSNSVIPKYHFRKKFPKNKNVQDWINNRLTSYDISTITIVKGFDKVASVKMTIESLRASYDYAVVESIESFFKVYIVQKKLKASRIKQAKLIETVNIEANTAKKEIELAKKESAEIKNKVTEISSDKSVLIEEIEVYKNIYNNTEYICTHINKVIMDVCSQYMAGKRLKEEAILQIRKKLLIDETMEKLHLVKLNL